MIDGIDIHGHAVPESFLREMARTRFGSVLIEVNEGRYVVTFPNTKPLRPCTGNMIDFVERLDWLDRQGLRQQLVGPWLDVQGHQLPASDGAVWARELNNAMVEAAGASGGRVRPHATLHLADAGAAARELERAVRELRMSSCMIPTNFPGGHLAEASYDALWEVAESLQAPVVLHPPTVAPSGCLFGEDMPDFRTLYGRLIDTTLTAARLVVAGIFERFPRLQIVLVHGGGMLPYQSGRFENEYGEKLNGASPTEQVRRFYYDSTLMSGPALRMLTELVGVGHVMLGSDYGAGAVERGTGLITDALRQASLDEPGREAIVHTNAEQIFRLGPVAN